MAEYDILIPTCGPHDGVLGCLDSIGRAGGDYRIIWLSNGAPGELAAAVAKRLERHPGSIRINSPENVFVSKGYNACLALSTARYVVIMSDDIEVVPGWLGTLRRVFDEAPVGERLGMAVPCVNDAGPLWAKRFGAPKDGALYGIKEVPMYVAMLSREVIRRVGYFSEEFRFAADDDYCRRLRLARFGIAIDLRSIVDHHRCSSSNAVMGNRRARLTLEECGLLREKFGGDAVLDERIRSLRELAVAEERRQPDKRS